jgi:hypothetical protein
VVSGDGGAPERIPRQLPEAEQQYWARKEQRGLRPEEQQARREFDRIFHAAFGPAGLAGSMAETTAWLRGERPTASPYWDQRPRCQADT